MESGVQEYIKALSVCARNKTSSGSRMGPATSAHPLQTVVRHIYGLLEKQRHISLLYLSCPQLKKLLKL